MAHDRSDVAGTGSNRRVALRLAAEFVLIVSSVLLALAVDEWREGRQVRDRVDTAMAGFQQEVRANLAQVRERLPYHVTLRTRFGELSRREEPPESLEQIFEAIPDWQGTRLPFLMDVAWEAAVASDVLRHMEYQLITTLAAAYRQQEWLEQRARQGAVALEPQNLRPETLPYTIQSTAIWLDDVVSMEASLYCQYTKVLDRLDRARGRRAPGVQPDSGSVPAGPDEPYAWPEGRLDTLGVSPISGQPITVGC